MADTTEMIRLIRHAADRLAQEDPTVNAREVRRVSLNGDTIEAAYRRALSETAAITEAIVVLRLVAACMADEPAIAQPAEPASED